MFLFVGLQDFNQICSRKESMKTSYGGSTITGGCHFVDYDVGRELCMFKCEMYLYKNIS